MRTMISFQCESIEEAQRILKAAQEVGFEPHACSKQYIEPKEVLGSAAAEIGSNQYIPPPKRENIDPGAPSIGKIGSGTKEQLLGMLAEGYQPPAKWAEHMKLLWSRGEIKYDGTYYYV